jgi:hypothetical protein
MTSTQLQPILAQAATDPAVLTHRRRHRETTTAHAHPEAIRTLGPTSITLLLAATTTYTTLQNSRQETSRYAVTVTRHGNSWQVYAIELAGTGDTGESATDGGLP